VINDPYVYRHEGGYPCGECGREEAHAHDLDGNLIEADAK
jgi:hypothetical protein